MNLIPNNTRSTMERQLSILLWYLAIYAILSDFKIIDPLLFLMQTDNQAITTLVIHQQGGPTVLEMQSPVNHEHELGKNVEEDNQLVQVGSQNEMQNELRLALNSANHQS